MQIATVFAESLADARWTNGEPLFATVTAAPPGFVNFRLSDAALEAVVERVLADPTTWGRVPAEKPERIDVEFVSANPTGPLHIGNARGAFVGDLLCRVLEAAGHEATREYYFNDFGGQVQKLGASVRAIRLGRPVPEDGYQGDYVHDLAREVPAELLEPRQATPRSTPPTGPLGAGRPSGSAPASRRASSAWASTSTSGRPKARSTTRAGSSAPWPGFARPARSTSPTARRGSARPTTATTRTA